MAAPAYSKLLVNEPSVSGVTELAVVPTGFIWVVRDVFMTYGSYIGFVRGGMGIGGVDPWLWITTTQTEMLIGVAKGTKEWHGRYVVPEGASLWWQTHEPDTVDVVMCGYELSAAGW